MIFQEPMKLSEWSDRQNADTEKCLKNRRNPKKLLFKKAETRKK